MADSVSTSYDPNASEIPRGDYSWHPNLKGVYWGPGAVQTALPSLLSELGIKKALLLTTRSLVETEIVAGVRTVLEKQGVYGATFCDVIQHNPIDCTRKGLQVLLEKGCDGIVTIGGGSCIEAGKCMIWFRMLHDREHTQNGDVNGTINGSEAKNVRPIPQIAIPTTLSAAEYHQVLSFVNEQNRKTLIKSDDIAVAGIVLDAEVTRSTPERLWFSTAIKALDHAIEWLHHPQLRSSPIRYLNNHAIADFFTYLPKSKEDPKNLDYKQHLQLASWTGFWPLRVSGKKIGIRLSHAIGHWLGQKYGIPHGITSCLTLAPAIALQTRMATLEEKKFTATTLSYLNEPSTGSLNSDIVKLALMVRQLIMDLGIHDTLSDHNVQREDLPILAKEALGEVYDGSHEFIGLVTHMLEGMYDEESGKRFWEEIMARGSA